MANTSGAHPPIGCSELPPLSFRDGKPVYTKKAPEKATKLETRRPNHGGHPRNQGTKALDFSLRSFLSHLAGTAVNTNNAATPTSAVASGLLSPCQKAKREHSTINKANTTTRPHRQKGLTSPLGISATRRLAVR